MWASLEFRHSFSRNVPKKKNHDKESQFQYLPRESKSPFGICIPEEGSEIH